MKSFFPTHSLARKAALALSTLSLACIATLSAHAQFRTSVQGVVTDPSGAAIPNVKVTLHDNATNATIVRTSDSGGVFNFNGLAADHFTLTAEAAGFGKKVLADLQFIPEQANSLNVELTLGAVDTTVTVDADSQPAVDTETSNIGATVSANQIQHLPSFNRDVFTLTQLTPGTIADGSQAAGGGVYTQPGNQGPGGSGNAGASPTENGVQSNANGGQYETNGISIDGISTVSAVWGGTSIITPSEESIDNVRVVTNDYDAEDGRFSGAQTLVTSKSGTNQIHGSAFFAMHRPGLNAFNRAPLAGAALRDSQRYNQYGGSIGGPIWKDKLFAFFAYETSPNNSNQTTLGWYETAAFRAAAPAGSIASTFLNFPGSAPVGTIVTSPTCTTAGLSEGVNCRTIAGQGLDIGSPLHNGLGQQDPTQTANPATPGVGGGLDGVADVAYYSTSTPYSSFYHQYNGRLDADPTKKDHLAFAIYWVPQGFDEYNGGARAYNLFHHSQINEALSIIWNHTFSSTFLNEARANAAGWRWNEISTNPQEPVGLPQDTVAQFGSQTLNVFGTPLGSILKQWTYTYKDVATKVLGQNTVKFGGEYTQLHYLNNPVGRPNYGFYNVWDFLNDAPYQEAGSFNSVTGQPGGFRTDQRENLFAGFVQDDWKVRPNFTLHAGIRYSYFGALYAKQNDLPYVVMGSGATSYTGLAIRTGGGIWDPQKGNFGPQFGFNWSPSGFKNKMVVRGGYGLNFNQEEIAITANSGYNPPTANYYTFQFDSPSSPGANGAKIQYGISSSPTSLSGYASNPNTIATYNSANLPTLGSASIIIVGDGHRKLPTSYSEHYSLETNYSFNSQLVATVGYQGSVGRHLINHETPNAPAVVAGYALNPLVTGGDFWQNIGSSNNNALLVELKHPMVHHLMIDAQFMYAKSMDTDGSGPYSEDTYFPLNASYSYGPSDYNVGKSFKVYGMWQPVFFHGNNNLMEKLVGGWSLSGIFNIHSGFPYSPNYGLSSSLYCTQCGYSNIRPQYNGGGGHDHSNKAFINGTNFANLNANAITNYSPVNVTPQACVGVNPPSSCHTAVAYRNAYFNVNNFYNQIEATNNSGFPAANIALPTPPGIGRNSFTGPGYRDVDATLAKSFGIPNNRILGDHAGFEIRADAFNLFNIQNLNPTAVSNNINTNFGQDTSALGGRTITIQGRFSF